jgi:hypothetical protein
VLNSVPRNIAVLTRNVVLNHPNTFNCKVFREVVDRTAATSVGTLPTMGGLGVLDAEDEENIRHEFLGNGFALPAEGFAPSPMMSEGDANFGPANEFRFLIEPEEPSGAPGHFDLRKHDVIYLVLGTGSPPPMIAFELVGTETTSNIPPYTTRYVCNRRDDLTVGP